MWVGASWSDPHPLIQMTPTLRRSGKNGGPNRWATWAASSSSVEMSCVLPVDYKVGSI